MLSELQVITSLLLPKGCISLSGTYEESGASYVICVTLCAAQIVSTTTATPLTPL